MICKSAMHSYDIWYRLSYLCIYIYIHIYIHNINLCICTNMRNCLKHAQNMSHTHERLTNIFMYVSCACMIYIYIHIYLYIHIHMVYIYIIRYWYISIYHMHRFRISHPCGLPQPQASGNLWLLRQETWGRTWWVFPPTKGWIPHHVEGWAGLSFQHSNIYIYLYNFIHTYVCVHMSLCVRVRVEIGGNPTKNIRMLIDASYRTQRFVIPHFLHVT